VFYAAALQFEEPPEITVVRQLLLHDFDALCWDAAITQQTCQVVESRPHPDTTATPIKKLWLNTNARPRHRHAVRTYRAIVKIPIDNKIIPCNTKTATQPVGESLGVVELPNLD